MILSNIAGKNVHSMFYKSFNEGEKSNALPIFISKWAFPSISYLLFFPMGLCYTPLHFCASTSMCLILDSVVAPKEVYFLDFFGFIILLDVQTLSFEIFLTVE